MQPKKPRRLSRGTITLSITADATAALIRLDNAFVGTPHYMGLAYFWHYDYRHYLRDAKPRKLVRIHNAFLDAGLELGGVSAAHEAIIQRVFPAARFV